MMPRFAKLASHAVTAGCVLAAIAVSHAAAQEHDIALPEQAQNRIPLTLGSPGDSIGKGEARPLYVTSDGSATHTTTPGTPVFGVDHDGVADLIITRSEGTARCTGSLLSDGQSLLTAAHCLTDNDGAPVITNVQATWQLAAGDVIQSSADVTIHPMYNGDLTDGYDIAIVQFDNPITTDVPRYDIYRKTDGSDIGVETVKVGYGRSGFGNTGDTIASGTKRFGKNKYEDDGLGNGGTGISNVSGVNNSDTQLTYDFDSNFRNLNNLSGTDSDHDAFQFFFGRDEDLGFGDDEVGAAPGDSGGPSFLFDDGEWLIAGVTSYGLRLQFTDGTTSDVDSETTPNSSWGEFGVDARVSSVQGFIDSSLIPEPHTVALVVTGGLILLHRAASRRDPTTPNTPRATQAGPCGARSRRGSAPGRAGGS